MFEEAVTDAEWLPIRVEEYLIIAVLFCTANLFTLVRMAVTYINTIANAALNQIQL